ncbi:MAG: LysE family transporter [Pseudomonadota bacterium]
MGIEHLIAFNIVLWAAIISPGPAFLVAVQTSLTAGRRAGIATGLGLATMAVIWTTLALLGLEVVFTIVPWAYTAVKTLGAAYLLCVAWGLWRGARDPISAKAKPAKHAFRQGMIINLLNPKSVLFAAAILVVVFPANMSIVDGAIVVLNHLVVEVAFYSCLALAMTTETVQQRYLQAKLYIDRTASVILGALGLRLLVSR